MVHDHEGRPPRHGARRLSGTNGFTGQADASARAGDFNQSAFMISQALSRVETNALVKVVAVTSSGQVAPAGYVDVQPLVNQVDGAGTAVPHGTIHGLPYFRLQGGTNAIIMDPVVGDIGMAGFCSRDISSVKANKAQANPGSRRRHDPADGIYFGGVLNGTATQYVQFSTAGIAIVSPTAVMLTGPSVQITGANSVAIASPSVAITGASFTHNGKNVGSTHEHSGVMPGGGDTGPPI